LPKPRRNHDSSFTDLHGRTELRQNREDGVAPARREIEFLRRKEVSKMENQASRTVRRRPAETGGVAGALALIIARAAGLDDPNLIVAIATVIGFAPAAVTWIVDVVRDAVEPAPAIREGS
jgi:hypothetical protein